MLVFVANLMMLLGLITLWSPTRSSRKSLRSTQRMSMCSSRSESREHRNFILTFTSSFSAAFSRLLELGVPTSQWVSSTPWEMHTLSEQKKD